MKKFARHKTHAEVKAQCAAQGVPFRDTLHARGDSDRVVVGHNISGVGYALYDTFNGSFFGKTDKGVEFDSRHTTHENEPWFQALLAFFYVEK